MSALNLTSMVLGMMTVTFAVRYVLLAFGERISLPDAVLRALQFVPVSVLSAITLPMILQPSGQFQLSPDSPHLAAGAVAVAMAGLRAPLIAVIVGSMTTFYLWRVIVA